MAILVIDDHPLMLSALALAVRSAAPDAEIIECSSMQEAEPHLADPSRLQLIVLDLKLPGVEGFSGLRDMVQLPGSPPIAVVSGNDDHFTAWNAVREGAAVFLPKSLSLEQMSAELRAALNGERTASTGDLMGEALGLTRVQRQVLEGVSRGKMNKQIAFELGVQESTIKWHLTFVFRKLGVTTRAQAMVAASKLGMATGDGPDTPSAT